MQFLFTFCFDIFFCEVSISKHLINIDGKFHFQNVANHKVNYFEKRPSISNLLNKESVYMGILKF